MFLRLGIGCLKSIWFTSENKVYSNSKGCMHPINGSQLFCSHAPSSVTSGNIQLNSHPGWKDKKAYSGKRSSSPKPWPHFSNKAESLLSTGKVQIINVFPYIWDYILFWNSRGDILHNTLLTLFTAHVWCESCSVVFSSLQPHGLYSSWNSPGQNTGVGGLSLLQGIFPTQGSNPSLPHCRRILYQLSHKGSPLLLIIIIIY